MPREAVPVTPEDAVQGLDQVRVQYVDLEVIRHWPMNPKEHDVGAIAASIERFGFRDPIAVNSLNHEIEEGHGRVDTLVALKDQGREPPQFVLAVGDKWHVPVIFFTDDEHTQHAYGLAHNRTQELGGGYDNARLLEVLREQALHDSLIGTGFDGDDVDSLAAKLAQDGAGLDTFASQYQVLIVCASEQEQAELLERFEAEGLSCRALVS